MSTSPTVAPRQVGILVLDSDPQGAGAVKQILDSEGWRVRVVPDTRMLLAELKTGEWSLVIADVEAMGIDTPAFNILTELASVSVEEGGRFRILYLIPEMMGTQYVAPLEAARLPYVIRPYQAIEAPLRQVRHEFGALRKKKKQAGRNTMFASRDSFSYTDEEIAEYEHQENELSKSKRNKPRINLGDPNR